MSKEFLPKPLRTQLENTVKAARDVAEKAAKAALFQLAVGDARVPEYLTEDQRVLRRRLRDHGRALGDTKWEDNSQTIEHLVGEVAYEHWHRMLFAQFLAENNLLLWEPGAPVTLAECEELVQDPATSQGATSGWELAGKLAARMLPQIFKPHSPVFELTFAPEHQRELERLLAGLPREVFQASDSLGWVYQFWQAKRKDEVNASEVKIGADELPAVTQLFTEPYMVEFMLHNSLGAWWVTRHPEKPCPIELTYLRRLEDGTPAAGKFEGWPDNLAEFKLLDPSCGSGHFLVAAFQMLVPMRMEAERLASQQAVDAVLSENLYGLEIDPRCVEIAVFALALAAWRYPDEGGNPLGVRSQMPAPHIACSGLKVSARPEDWEALVPSSHPDAEWLRQEMRALHEGFAQAPLLGSLLDPSRFLKEDLATPDFSALSGLLQRGLGLEKNKVPLSKAKELGSQAWDAALSASGLLEAARILTKRYHLVITNVPYLKRSKQSDELKTYCRRHYPSSEHDLANVFLDRCLELAGDGGTGAVQIVMPQNWLFLGSYQRQRERLLRQVTWNFVALLGPKGFQTPMWDFNVQLLVLTKAIPPGNWVMHGLDATEPRSALDKSVFLESGGLRWVSQKQQLQNPDARISLDAIESANLLGRYADSLAGIQTGDYSRFGRYYWEQPLSPAWIFQQGTVEKTADFAGRSSVLFWENGQGSLSLSRQAYIRGRSAWGREGVAVSQMASLPVTRYSGEAFDNNTAAIVVRDVTYLPAIWCFCSSAEFNGIVRRVDRKLNVTNATLVKVPFDLNHWQQVARQRYPHGLPKPYSDDPTQWIFHGHPYPATDPLQVGIARLLGYTWPAESDEQMELSEQARTWIARAKALGKHESDDGIVCLNAVRGQRPAHERLLALLIDAWESAAPGSWNPAVLGKLVANVDSASGDLESWLRDKFFEPHAKLFHHRPFIWHIWDGLRDGFSALVNYHKLDAKNLERLIHTYLGDWIRTQEDATTNGDNGAQQRLAAAFQLKTKLEAILEGEAPYDIFVRWKPLDQQPIGWNPDLNDGVRVNIRPFVTAGVLRHNNPPKLNIKWGKDKGKDVESAPWFSVFKGERINDHHLTLAEKLAAREKKL